MFKITPIVDVDLHKACAEAVGVPYREGYFAYTMNDADSGELMGFSQFEIDKNGGYISEIAETDSRDDFEAMFILGRQTMNFINMCGAEIIRANRTDANEKLLLAIGFRKNAEGEFVCNTNGMFDGHCSGHAVKL